MASAIPDLPFYLRIITALHLVAIILSPHSAGQWVRLEPAASDNESDALPLYHYATEPHTDTFCNVRNTIIDWFNWLRLISALVLMHFSEMRWCRKLTVSPVASFTEHGVATVSDDVIDSQRRGLLQSSLAVSSRKEWIDTDATIYYLARMCPVDHNDDKICNVEYLFIVIIIIVRVLCNGLGLTWHVMLYWGKTYSSRNYYNRGAGSGCMLN